MKLILLVMIVLCAIVTGQAQGQSQEEYINSLYLKHLKLLKEPNNEALNEPTDKSVDFMAPGHFKFTIKKGKQALVFITDYEFGELSYEKFFNDNLYQSGKFYFKTNGKNPYQYQNISDFGSLSVNDFSVAKGSCGGRLSTLNEIMNLMEDLIDSGVDPQSDLIGNLMTAALSALRDLMTCMQR